MSLGASYSSQRSGLPRALAAVAVVALAAAACAGPTREDDGGEPQVLRISTAWRRSVSGPEFRERVRALDRALERLRDETGSGWTGRQDDITGYLAELSGGRFVGQGEPEDAMTSLLDAYGPELFGVGSDAVEVVSTEPVAPGVEALRLEQQQAEVPVLDGAAVVTVSGVDAEPHVNTVRGRLFPGLEGVATEPEIEAAEAVRTAEGDAGGAASGEPRLVVVPVGDSGALAWEVSVVSEGTEGEFEAARYYVDAVGGGVVLIRAGNAALAAPVNLLGRGSRSSGRALRLLRRLQQDMTACEATGESVEVTGTDPLGDALRGQGLMGADGSVLLVDVETPTFDPASGSGAVCTFDATGLDEAGLPGPIARSGGPAFDDSEALSAHVFSRYVQDYYREVHGRDSWDGQGADLISSVHFGPSDFCNAFFSDSLDPPQMVYGPPCVRDGEPHSGPFTEIDVAAHEITHGVTDSTAGLLYVGQSGALNEAFSDYFGNTIGDRYRGRDSSALGESMCEGLTPPTSFCESNPDGSASLRYMPNGSGFGEYANLLSTPIKLILVGFKQDRGGVHLNSAIWNNALWSIRSELARLDGQPMLTSARAAAFDRAVYAALTRHLGPGSGFLDARAAVEQAAGEVGLDAAGQRVMRRTFDANEICAGCAPTSTPGLGVSTTSASQQLPALGTSRVAWIDLSIGEGILGQAAFAAPGTPEAQPLSGRPDALSVAVAGDDLVTAEDPPKVVRYDVQAQSSEVLDPNLSEGDVIVGVAGSAEGAAWLNLQAGEMRFVDAGGTVTSAPYPADAGAPFSIGAGGGTVVVGTEDGEVIAWRPGSDPEIVGDAAGMAFSVDVHGDRAVALLGAPGEYDAEVIVIPLEGGSPQLLSETASPFGVAMNERYVVWAQNVGQLRGAVAEAFDVGAPDTDLWLYSPGTGTTYEVLDARGQQGFPDISGDRLVWQDALLGGDDIFTGTLPGGL